MFLFSLVEKKFTIIKHPVRTKLTNKSWDNWDSCAADPINAWSHRHSSTGAPQVPSQKSTLPWGEGTLKPGDQSLTTHAVWMLGGSAQKQARLKLNIWMNCDEEIWHSHIFARLWGKQVWHASYQTTIVVSKISIGKRGHLSSTLS